MKRIAGTFAREPSGRLVFVLRREERPSETADWAPVEGAEHVSIEVAVSSSIPSATVAQEVAAALFASCVAPGPTDLTAPAEDDAVTDLIELGNPPTTDPMGVS